MTRIPTDQPLLELVDSEEGRAYAWGGGSLLFVVLLVVLLIILL